MLKRLLPLIILTGCQYGYTPQKQAYDQTLCTQMGAQSEQQMYSCMQARYQDRVDAANRRSAAMAQASGILLAQGNQPPPVMQPMPRQVYCSSQWNPIMKQTQTFCR